MYRNSRSLCVVIGIVSLGLVWGCPMTGEPVDQCASVTCGDGEVCANGVCVATDPCDGVTCDAGSTCVDGDCVADDPCADVQCPDGETCVDGNCTAPEPSDFDNADVVRGGSLYDKWWVGVGVDAPTENHVFWAARPDTETNERTGADTWRCKECHGWDYKGVNGAYSSGSHRTGIAGVFGTQIEPQAAFDFIKTAHGFGDAGMDDASVWDVVKFIKEGQIDTDAIIDDAGAFTGDAANGLVLYESGIGTNIGCIGCHGADGLQSPSGHEEFDDFVGKIANENPWEFQHKVRFGQPGAVGMPAAAGGGGTLQDANDLGTHAQTLPTGPTE